jgi:hypothetical protein
MATAVPGFEDARKALDELLSNLTFLKVVTVQKNNNSFTGEAVELGNSKRLAFFDKFGRARSFLNIGPLTLTQAPMGFDHPTSVPGVGDIIVGVLVQNVRKSHLSHVLRGWSSDAKPLFELARMVRFGTKKSEFENRTLLLQPAGLMPLCAKYRDEIYCVARIVLWKNVRPLQVLSSIQNAEEYKLKEPASDAESTGARALKLSTSASEFVQMVAVKLACPDIIDTFSDGFVEQETKFEPIHVVPNNSTPNSVPVFVHNPVPVPQGSISYYPFTSYGPMAPVLATPGLEQRFRPTSPLEPPPTEYNPTSPSRPYNPTSPLPPYCPSSPTYDLDM